MALTLTPTPEVTLGLARKKKYPIQLKDGTIVELDLWPKIFGVNPSTGKDWYKPNERAALVTEAFRRQYKMPPKEFVSGFLSHLAHGATLGTSDEMAGVLEGMFTSAPWVSEDDRERGPQDAIDRQRTTLQKFSMKYPYISMFTETAGATIPIVLDVLFGTRGAVSAPLAAGTLAEARQMGLTNILHPLRVSTPKFLPATIEAAAKTGPLSAIFDVGAAEGPIEQRFGNAQEAFNWGAGLGAVFTGSLMGVAKVPAAARTLREIGDPTLLRRARQFVGGSVMAGAQRMANLSRSGDATLTPAERDLRVRDMFNEFMPPSAAVRPLTEPTVGTPWGSLVKPLERPMLAEGLGINVLDPVTNLPLRDPNLPAILKWGSNYDTFEGGRLAEALRERGITEPGRIEAALRREFGPFPFNHERALAGKRQDAQEVWEAFYRDAYFNPDTAAIITVPLTGGRTAAEPGFIRMFSDDPVTFKKVYERAVSNRSSTIAAGDWVRHIDGVSQQLPSWEMFLAGERWIPASTFKDHAARLEGLGWRRLKNTDGTFVVDDGNFVIANRNKQVEVKTLHDMRIAFDDLIDMAEGQRAGILKRLRGQFDRRLKTTAGDEMTAADEAFSSQKGLEEAGQAGLGATEGQFATPATIKAQYNQLETAVEKRMFLSGFAQTLQANEVTAEQILSNPKIRSQVEAIFPNKEAFGRFLAEVAVSGRMAQTRAQIGDPAVAAELPMDTNLSAKMWSLFAKIPAYKFSAMFAGARDLTQLARTMMSRQNRVMASESHRLLKAQSPEELAVVLKELDDEFRRTLPKEAAELRQLAALLRAAINPNEPRLQEFAREKVPGVKFAQSLFDY